MFSLEGKKALITGATGGIGETIARQLQQQGATIFISGTRAEKLNALKDELGSDVFAQTCNLSDADDIKNLVETAESQMGQIDILVNNAGITKDGLFMRMKDDDWNSVIDINLTAAMKLSRAAIRGMMKRRFGRIVSISSVVGVMGNAGQVNYAASKAGMIGMSKSIARELAARGVTANVVAPGYIATAMTDALNETQKEAISSNIPAQRMGTPEEVASAVCFLASNEAGYINGETIHVNGGMIMV